MYRQTRSGKRNKKWIRYLLMGVILILGITSIYIWNVFNGVKEATNDIYQPVDGVTTRTDEILSGEKKPFSVLLLGVDSGDFGRAEQGRSDSMMVATINPNTKKTVLLSIPRDTYTEIVDLGTWDKINHAYAFGGTAMAIKTVQEMLNIPIDYYVMVNMAGVKEIVDAIGGIDVVSPLTFSYEGHDFIEGEVSHMDGDRALAYARMRYEDLDGDYGRQRRQRTVIQGIIDKATSSTILYNYQDVLAALSNNVQTNFPVSEFLSMQSAGYIAAAKNIEPLQMGGAGGEGSDGIWYHFVPDEDLLYTQGLLQSELEMD